MSVKDQTIIEMEKEVGPLAEYFERASVLKFSLAKMSEQTKKSKPVVSQVLDNYGYEYADCWIKRAERVKREG